MTNSFAPGLMNPGSQFGLTPIDLSALLIPSPGMAVPAGTGGTGTPFAITANSADASAGRPGVTLAANVVPANGDFILNLPEMKLDQGAAYRFIVVFAQLTVPATPCNILLNDLINFTTQTIEAAASGVFHTATAILRPTSSRATISARAASTDAQRPVFYVGTRADKWSV